MDTVSIETTVVGNIAGRMHPDPLIAARQIITRKWWATASDRYHLFVSQLTLDECRGGDPDAAKERLDVITDIRLIDPSDEAKDLAELLVARLAIPASEPRDALHVAIAAVNRAKFTPTWKLEYILNPHLQRKIADACREGGFEPPVICTPQQLLETEYDS